MFTVKINDVVYTTDTVAELAELVAAINSVATIKETNTEKSTQPRAKKQQHETPHDETPDEYAKRVFVPSVAKVAINAANRLATRLQGVTVGQFYAKGSWLWLKLSCGSIRKTDSAEAAKLITAVEKALPKGWKYSPKRGQFYRVFNKDVKK